MSTTAYDVERVHWRPNGSDASDRMCRVSSCRSRLTTAMTSHTPGSRDTCPKLAVLKGVPDFTQPRLIIWYQNHCNACQNSKVRVFPSVRKVAEERGFTVHELEVTKDILDNFPHVETVPLYDLITPSADPSACSPYGPGTQNRVIKNDLQDLQREFPTFVLLPETPVKR